VRHDYPALGNAHNKHVVSCASFSSRGLRSLSWAVINWLCQTALTGSFPLFAVKKMGGGGVEMGRLGVE